MEKEVSVGGQKNVARGIRRREMASATHFVSDCASTSVCV